MIRINKFHKEAPAAYHSVLPALIPQKSMFVLTGIMLVKHDQISFFFKVKFGESIGTHF